MGILKQHLDILLMRPNEDQIHALFFAVELLTESQKVKVKSKMKTFDDLYS